MTHVTPGVQQRTIVWSQNHFYVLHKLRRSRKDASFQTDQRNMEYSLAASSDLSPRMPLPLSRTSGRPLHAHGTAAPSSWRSYEGSHTEYCGHHSILCYLAAFGCSSGHAYFPRCQLQGEGKTVRSGSTHRKDTDPNRPLRDCPFVPSLLKRTNNCFVRLNSCWWR
eukprot:2788821-Amphidinium_carterae.2